MASSRIYSGAGFVHTGAIRQPDPSSFEHRLVNRFAYPQSRTRSDPGVQLRSLHTGVQKVAAP